MNQKADNPGNPVKVNGWKPDSWQSREAMQQALQQLQEQKREKATDSQDEAIEELLKAAGNVGTTIFHPVGTCKMGRADDGTAVVDPQLRGLLPADLVDIVLMRTQRKTPTVIHPGYKISRIRSF